MATCNTCAIDTGFVEGCGAKPGGGNYVNISLLPSCNINLITIDVNNVVTNITQNPAITVPWLTVKVRKDTLSTNEVLNPNGSIQQNVAFTIGNYSDNADKETAAAEQSSFLNALRDNDEGMVLIIRDKNGVRRIYGRVNGLTVATIDKQSGLVSTDLNGTLITLTEVQPTFAEPLDVALVAIPITGPNINLIDPS